MSQLVSYLNAAADRLTASVSGEWRKGPKITTADLLSGTGGVERVDWLKTGKDTGNLADENPAKPIQIMGFGKFRDRQLSDIKQNEPGYWKWAVAEIKGFDKKAKAAGL